MMLVLEIAAGIVLAALILEVIAGFLAGFRHDE